MVSILLAFTAIYAYESVGSHIPQLLCHSLQCVDFSVAELNESNQINLWTNCTNLTQTGSTHDDTVGVYIRISSNITSSGPGGEGGSSGLGL